MGGVETSEDGPKTQSDNMAEVGAQTPLTIVSDHRQLEDQSKTHINKVSQVGQTSSAVC
jgi:hypothetical protein